MTTSTFDSRRALPARFHLADTATALDVAFWLREHSSTATHYQIQCARTSFLKALGCESAHDLAMKIDAARIDAMAKGAGTDVACAAAVVEMLFAQMGISESDDAVAAVALPEMEAAE